MKWLGFCILLTLLLTGCGNKTQKTDLSFSFPTTGFSESMTLEKCFLVNYNFDAEAIDPTQPAQVWYNFKAEPEPDEDDSHLLLGDFVELDLTQPVHISVSSKLATPFSSQIKTKITIQQGFNRKYQDVAGRRSFQEHYFYLGGENVSIQNLNISISDGHTGFGLLVGGAFSYVFKVLLYVLILLAVAGILGLCLGFISPCGVETAFASMAVVWTWMKIWEEIPALQGKAFQTLTGIMLRVGHFFHFSKKFVKTQGLFNTLVEWVVILVFVAATVFLLSMLDWSFRTILALIFGIIFNLVFYIPLYSIAFDALAVILIVAIATPGVIGFYKGITAPITYHYPSFYHSSSSDEEEEEEDDIWTQPQKEDPEWVYGPDGINYYGVSRDSNGSVWIYDDEGHAHFARETSPGKYVDENDNEYWS